MSLLTPGQVKLTTDDKQISDLSAEEKRVLDFSFTEKNKPSSAISDLSGYSQLSGWSGRQEQNQRKRLSLQALQTLQQTSMYWRASVESKRKLTKTMYETILRRNAWFKSFQLLDPRFQILIYFDEVARQGGPLDDPLAPPLHSFDLMRGFAKSTAFTVWRPTSLTAMRRMMMGEATGKGLNVKGKSAKCGKLSGLIPFLQIYYKEHKKKLRLSPSSGRITIYYKSSHLRDIAKNKLNIIAQGMQSAITLSKRMLSNKFVEDEEREALLTDLLWEVDDWEVYELDENGFGLDVPERVFMEAYITRQDISRRGEEEIGRPSEPAFQDMNFHSARIYTGVGPRTVVLQTSEDERVLRPQTLVVAYEEQGKVLPVASDFDCFVVGTRGVVYDEPMAKDQIDLMKWLIGQIENVLAGPRSGKNWTSRWLEVLKENSSKGFHPEVPRYGFGDPKSTAIVEGGVARFAYQRNGAVRHGAECFNYYFPQELDTHFLVISDTLPGKIPWKYVDAEELKAMLLEKIDEEFCFPINPKWILADKGWKRIYDKMLVSPCEDTQISMETWYPKDSGIREMIEDVHQRFPDGFSRKIENISFRKSMLRVGSEAMHLAQEELHLAEDELRRYILLRKAKIKLRAVFLFKKRDEIVQEISRALRIPTDGRRKFKFLDKFKNLRFLNPYCCGDNCFRRR